MPPEPHEPESDALAHLLAAAGERPAAADDPRVAALRDDLAAVEAAMQDESSRVDAATVKRAEATAVEAVRAFAERPVVAGRIRPARESDAASPVWRYAKWPLGAAAALVLGLSLLTVLQDETFVASADGPAETASAEQEASEPVIPDAEVYDALFSPMAMQDEMFDVEGDEATVNPLDDLDAWLRDVPADG
jgi:hypothetical protein